MIASQVVQKVSQQLCRFTAAQVSSLLHEFGVQEWVRARFQGAKTDGFGCTVWQSLTTSKTNAQQLPEVGNALNLKIYPPIRDSSEFPNSSSYGLPLQKYRPSHVAGRDFEVIADD